MWSVWDFPDACGVKVAFSDRSGLNGVFESGHRVVGGVVMLDLEGAGSSMSFRLGHRRLAGGYVYIGSSWKKYCVLATECCVQCVERKINEHWQRNYLRTYLWKILMRGSSRTSRVVKVEGIMLRQ